MTNRSEVRTYRFAEAVDLTQELANGMPIYSGNPIPSFESFKTLEKDGVNLTSLTLGSHTGTHMDAPKHFIQNGAAVDEIPPSRLVGEAYAADLTGLPRGSGITASDLETQLGAIPLEDVVVICYTGCSERWGDERITRNYTYMTKGAAEYLVSRRVRAVGIDFLSVEKFKSPEPAAHKELLGHGVFIIEALSSATRRFLGKRFLLICLPIKLMGGDGAPSRVIAVPITY